MCHGRQNVGLGLPGRRTAALANCPQWPAFVVVSPHSRGQPDHRLFSCVSGNRTSVTCISMFHEGHWGRFRLVEAPLRYGNELKSSKLLAIEGKELFEGQEGWSTWMN